MGTPYGGPGGPRSAFADHDLCGVYYAKVTDNKDEREVPNSDGTGASKVKGCGGRVRVSFPWLPEAERDKSWWAHVAVPLVGENFGTYFLPEIGDMVVVVFIAGDISVPVIIGSAWNRPKGDESDEEKAKKDPPPEVNEDGRNDFRVIKSRIGHRLLFDDSKIKPNSATANTKLIVTDYKDENVIACGKRTRSGQSPHNTYQVPACGAETEGVAVASLTGTLNIWCPEGNLTIKAPHVEFIVSEEADLNAGGKFSYTGSSNVAIRSAAIGRYEGSTIEIGQCPSLAGVGSLTSALPGKATGVMGAIKNSSLGGALSGVTGGALSGVTGGALSGVAGGALSGVTGGAFKSPGSLMNMLPGASTAANIVGKVQAAASGLQTVSKIASGGMGGLKDAALAAGGEKLSGVKAAAADKAMKALAGGIKKFLV